MDIIKIGIEETNSNICKVIKYVIDLILSYHSKYKIEIIPIQNDYNDIMNLDWIILGVKYDDNIQNFNLEISNNILRFSKFTNFIVVVEHNEKIANEKYYYEYDTNQNILLAHINLSEMLEYLSVISDDILSVDIRIIDKILLDELGKQKYRGLNSYDKKIKEIKNLIKNEIIVSDWMETIGFDKLLDLLQQNLIEQYKNIIYNHCLITIGKILNNFENSQKISNFQVDELSNLIDELLKVYDTFEKQITNSNLDENDKFSKEILTEYEKNYIVKNINTSIINISTNFDIKNQFDYEFLEKYLDLIKRYITLFQINNNEINLIIINLMKNKMMYKFSEELFNELSLLKTTIQTNDYYNNENNLNNLFQDSVGTWIKNDPNNFYDLIKYSKKINQTNQINQSNQSNQSNQTNQSNQSNQTNQSNQSNQTKIVINEFINYMESIIDNINNDYYYQFSNFIGNIDKTKLIQAFELILNPKDLKSKENISEYDTILISKLIYVITIIILQENTLSYKNEIIKQTIYIFDKYICDFVNYNDENHNLFIHNIYLNYSKIVNKIKTNGNLIEFDEYKKIHICFKQILKILFDFVGYNGVFTLVNTKISDNNEIQSKNNNTIELSDNSKSDDVSQSDVSQSDETESDEDDDKQIDKIYGFIKKTMSGKHLNQQTLRNISIIYWNKTEDYNDSIKLFESDLKNKKFSKIYKENNKIK
jgi:hypothetical protein